MDGGHCNLDFVFKRPNPFAEDRARMVRSIILLASTIVFAYLVASLTGYDLPRPHDVWDDLVTLSRAIAQLPA